jgi:hypothetical protein
VLTNLALFRAKPGQAEALGVALTDLVEPTRREAGCVSYDLHHSFDDVGSPPRNRGSRAGTAGKDRGSVSVTSHVSRRFGKQNVH